MNREVLRQFSDAELRQELALRRQERDQQEKVQKQGSLKEKQLHREELLNRVGYFRDHDGLSFVAIAENMGLKMNYVRTLYRDFKVREDAKVQAKKMERLIEKQYGPEALLHVSLDEVPMGIRTSVALQQFNIKTVGDLLKYSSADLLRAKNFGRKSLKEIHWFLQDVGLALRGETPLGRTG